MEEIAPDAGASPPVTFPGGSRGTTQTGVRLYNERLILSLIRRHRSLAKVGIARLARGTRSVSFREFESGEGLEHLLISFLL